MEINKPTVVDLFCGSGGLSLGFQEAGFQIVAGVDCDKSACATLERNHTDTKVFCKYIQDLETSEILDVLDGRQPDVVIGGPSCQGFSTVGPRNFDDPRNTQFKEFVRLVADLKPKCILMENVVGLLLYKKGEVGRQICEFFQELGYETDARILLAADFGVPQLRRRVFFIGNRLGVENAFPKPTHCDPALWEDYALPFTELSAIGQKNGDKLLPMHLSVRDAIGDLPPLKEQDGTELCAYGGPASSEYQQLMRRRSNRLYNHVTDRMSESERKMVKFLQPGQNWRALPVDLLPDRFKRIRPYDATTLLMRMRWERPAYTITTKSSEVTSGAFIHPSQDRTLSVREAARLQSYPDRFRFLGTQQEQRRQIGNSVPPLLAQRLAEGLKSILNHHEDFDACRLIKQGSIASLLG